MDSSKRNYREVLGEALKTFRENKGLSAYAVAQRGKIRVEQAQAVESGDRNYTIDVFLGYISGANLYMYFADKSDSGDITNFAEMLEKGKENDPEK